MMPVDRLGGRARRLLAPLFVLAVLLIAPAAHAASCPAVPYRQAVSEPAKRQPLNIGELKLQLLDYACFGTYQAEQPDIKIRYGLIHRRSSDLNPFVIAEGKALGWPAIRTRSSSRASARSGRNACRSMGSWVSRSTGRRRGPLGEEGHHEGWRRMGWVGGGVAGIALAGGLPL